MNLKRLVFILLIFASLVGMLLPMLALAQADDPQVETTPTLEEVIPKQDIPGDTSALLIVAGILALIVFGGVLWCSRR